MVDIILIWIAMFAGLISATIFPYIRKWAQAANRGEPFKFDAVYLYNLAVATGVTSLGNILFFLEYIPPSNLPDPVVLVLAFMYGYAGFEAEKLAYKYYKVVKERRAQETITAEEKYG